MSEHPPKPEVDKASLLAEKQTEIETKKELELLLEKKKAELTLLQKKADKENDRIRTRAEIDKMFDEAQSERATEIASTRSEYIEAYADSIKNAGGFKKLSHKIANFFGINRKDAFTDTGSSYEDLRSSVARTQYETAKNKTVADRFSEKRVSAQAEKLQKRNWTNADIEKLKARYKKMILRKSGVKEFSIDKDFDFVKTENESLRADQNTAWEAHKSQSERMMEKAGQWLDNHPKIKKTLGNKWLRFGMTTSAAAGITVLSGGALSAYFFANRGIRFVAGTVIGTEVGRGVVAGLEKYNVLGKTEEVILKRTNTLESEYKKGNITASQYDKGMQEIDLKIKRLNATKMAIIGGSAIGFGKGATELEHDLFDMKGGVPDEIDIKKTPNTDLEDAERKVSPVSPKQTFEEALRNRPNPVVESTQPTPPEPTEPQTIQKTVTPEAVPAPEMTASTTPDKIAIVEAGSGKGIEHAFRAQIENDPTLAATLKELYHYTGDISTTEELHKFSGVAAHQMALAEGYVGADGSERWVTGTAAYEIEMEGNEVVIHERVLDNGTWIETETSTGQFETGDDKDSSGDVYEKTHAPEHHNPTHPENHAPRTHVEEIKKSIDKIYTEPTMKPNTPSNNPIDLPPPTRNVVDLPPPAKGVIDLPPPTIQQHPTVPVQSTQPSFVPPSTRPDPMHNQRFQMGTPGRRTLLENLFSKTEENAQKGTDMAMNSASTGKDFLTILIEGFFGPETPSTPVTPPNPLETGGGGPMTA